MRRKSSKPRPAPNFCGNCTRGVVLLNADGSRWDPTVGGPCRVAMCRCRCRRQQRDPIRSDHNEAAAHNLRVAWQAD
jgi:hypothetical protein